MSETNLKTTPDTAPSDLAGLTPSPPGTLVLVGVGISRKGGSTGELSNKRN